MASEEQLLNQPTSANPLSAAFREAQDRLMVDRLKVACVLTITIVPMAVIMDYFVYPYYAFGSFLINRLACTLVGGLILIRLFKPKAVNRVHLLTYIWVNVLFAYNAFMISYVEGIMSPYYAGLNLVVLGACLLIPWSFTETLACGIAAIVWYAAACVLHFVIALPPSDSHPWFRDFFNNVFITLFTVTICSTAGYFSARLRYRDFELQFELDRKTKELEESYRELKTNRDALEQSYQKLEQHDRMKNQFFANISHELRTPLTLILSPLENLRMLPSTHQDPKLRETLNLMYSDGLRLLSLINDLLDLVRLGDGKIDLNLELVDLEVFVSGIAGSMRDIAERCELKLNIESDGEERYIVEGDKDRLEKVFVNLLFNSVKYTPQGGSIRVHLSQDDTWVSVHVEDTGVGIAEEHLSSVFNRFWQEDGSDTKARSGTGIGLALVKELVELHKGTVNVTSKKGSGSTFTVRLPRVSSEDLKHSTVNGKDVWLHELNRKAQYAKFGSAENKQAQSDSSAHSNIKHSILVAEDEPGLQNFLRSELEQIYNVLTASDGQEAWEMAHRHQPKLIVSDMMLPKMDGISLCRQLKSSPSLLPTKILLLTARADDRTKLKALEGGADDFLSKPFSILELKTRLANLLLTGQLERELASQNRTLETTIRQLRTAESQLVQNARLSALGSLTAGIMHEINNPVNFMLTAIHYLKSGLQKDSSDTLTTVADLEEGLHRIRDIINDLKGFAYGRSTHARQDCNPAKILRTAKRLLAAEILEDVTLEETVDSERFFHANENQMIQLMVNVIQNALHATKANDPVLKPRLIRITMKSGSQCYEISVWDNGSGIQETDLEKLCDPFFTTKQVGEGTGLGLSMCHTIVKDHGGSMTFKSRYSEFTECVIQIPLRVDQAPVTTGPLESGLA